MNIKKEIDNLSNIKNIDEKIKKIEIINQEIEQNKKKLKNLMDNIQSNNIQSINNQNVNNSTLSLDELKNKFNESININEKINYYQLFASKINSLENELYAKH
jgi:hypothetical protein